MRILRYLFLNAFLLFSCSSNDDASNATPNDMVPTVTSVETYDVLFEENVVYGQGMSHTSLNSDDSTEIPLRLDVYYPDNTSNNRPAYMFIHGGGFIGGSKQGSVITNLANYYTSRGWVFVSIDYRLRDDLGTLPQAWIDFTSTLEPALDPTQANAIYPAQRDAKAALRWLVANSDVYGINTDYITVGGGSAGAITAITLGISEPEDFRDELSLVEDPTLATTNMNASYHIRTVVDHWGSNVALDILEEVYGHYRFDTDDPALFIAHGTQDTVVEFSNALELKAIYEDLGLPIAFFPIDQPGHGLWNAIIDNKRLEELAFEFIVEQQGLDLEE